MSAVTGEGTEKLLETLADRLRALNAVVELSVPYERGDVLAALHREGEVLVEVHDEQATRVRARLPKGGSIASGSSWPPRAGSAMSSTCPAGGIHARRSIPTPGSTS